MLEKIEARLVDSWRQFYKRASIWLAAIVGAVTPVIAANQSIYLTLVSYLPKEGIARVLSLIALGVSVFLVPAITVLVKQKSVSGDKTC